MQRTASDHFPSRYSNLAKERQKPHLTKHKAPHNVRWVGGGCTCGTVPRYCLLSERIGKMAPDDNLQSEYLRQSGTEALITVARNTRSARVQHSRKMDSNYALSSFINALYGVFILRMFKCYCLNYIRINLVVFWRDFDPPNIKAKGL